MLVARRHAIAPLLHREVAAGAGIERSVGAMRRVGGGRDLALDLGAAAEAGIDQAALVELVQRLAVGRRNVRTGDAPRRPSRSPAISDRPESPSRIRAGSGGCRCPRCAPGRCRRPRARDASRSRPNRREPRCSSPVGLGAKRVTTLCRTGGMIRRYSGLARRAMPGASWRQKLRWFSTPPISRRRCGIWRRSIRISRAS